MYRPAARIWTAATLILILTGAGWAGWLPSEGVHRVNVTPLPADAAGLDALLSPAGGSVVTMRPGEIRTFINTYTFDPPTADAIVAVLATPEIPSFVTFAFNGANKVSLMVIIQYRLEVDVDAPGGSYPVRIVYEFFDNTGAIVNTREITYTLVIDAPPPPDDHGDDCDTATAVALGGSASGELTAGDVDLFRVELTEAGTLTAFTTGSTDTVGTLLDDACNPLIVDQNSGQASNFSISSVLNPGVYHVAVGHADEAGAGAYVLRLQFQVLDQFQNRLYFPQFANGGGLSSELTLLNLAATSAANALIEIRGDDGSPLDLGLAAPTGVGGEVSVAVPVMGSASLTSGGMGSPVSGSVTVRSDQPLVGVLVFGGSFGLAGVSSSPIIGGEMAAPVVTGPGAGVNTGVALQNLEDAETSFEAELRSASGQMLASSAPFALAARGHRAVFVSDLDWDAAIDFEAGLRATLIVRSLGGDYAAVVLLVRPGQLATLPVVVQ